MFLRRLKPPKMGVRQSTRIDCPGHLKWVRGFACAVGCTKFGIVPNCLAPIDAHHTTTRGAGGGDDTVIPLCRYHHSLLDSPGWSQKRLEEACGVDFKQLAADLWRRSPHRIKWERKGAT